MNANTAMKINDAVAQAVKCGEAEFEIRSQVEKALKSALIQKTEAEIVRLGELLSDLHTRK